MISHAPLLLGWDETAGLFHVTVIASAGLLLWLAVTGMERIRFRRQLYSHTPDALFSELCRAHHLSRGQRRLLSEVARELPREHCCSPFIDRQRLEQFAKSHPDDAAECERLALRLFGTRQSV